MLGLNIKPENTLQDPCYFNIFHKTSANFSVKIFIW